MRAPVFFITVLLFFYLCGAFISAEFNIALWSEFVRTIVVLIGAPVAAVATLAYESYL